ncbi:DUF3307 domain-containing protein [Meridianimarinicoccus sp. RP-17]|uniref:DUF3307 domain-containing protein n=1 Tax=Meridianimarinicoccus zhengii TaxID=2056810 RepID=UPI000DACFF27|nr:DUF3307 domain-containing protein [Phycocomes zhengii]
MIETFAALLVAHVAADYVFQTRWMALNKTRPGPLAAHIAVVWAATWVCLGCSSVLAVTFLAFVHLLMDLAKARWLGGSGLAYGLDQSVHVLSALGIAVMVPGAWAAGHWAGLDEPARPALVLGVVVMGAVYALRGGFYFAALMPAPRDSATPRAVPLVSCRAILEGLAVFAGMLALPLLAGLVGLARLCSYLWLWHRQEVAPGGRLARQAALLGWVVVMGFGTHLMVAGLLGLEAADAGVYVPP